MTEPLHTCGTRAVIKVLEERFYVVCSDCGNKKHVTEDLATAIIYATDTSDRKCSACGNEAKLS